MVMRFIFVLLFVYLCSSCKSGPAELKEDNLDMSALLQPVPEYAFLKDSTYFTWGASPIRGDDGLYHLYYSR